MNRLGNMDLTFEEKELLFNMSIDDAIKLMNTFYKWKWNTAKSINAICWMMATLLENGDIDEEDLRVMFAGIKLNAKFFKERNKGNEDAST